MKLFLKREQADKFFGGVAFVLNIHVEITTEERELIQKYKTYKEVLLVKTDSFFAEDLTIQDLLGYLKFNCKSIDEVLGYEKRIKQACERMKTYLEAMKSFGGEEVIEF